MKVVTSHLAVRPTRFWSKLLILTFVVIIGLPGFGESVRSASLAVTENATHSMLEEKDMGDEIGQPGPAHKRLNKLIGQWRMAIKIWNGPKDTEPLSLSGTLERRWILKGRFIEERSKELAEQTLRLSEFRGRRPVTKRGEIYESVGYLGYDRLAGIFEHILIHDDSTRMYYRRGRFDPSREAIVLTGSWTDPYDGTYILSRCELNIADADRHIMVRYISDEDTGEFKDMEIVYTRID